MLRRLILLLLLAGGLGLALAPAAGAARACRYVLGFAALHDQLSAIVGACLGDEAPDPATGDALQHTTGGLLVWRKADNWTAFTDGSRTWVNGPDGVQERPNTQRFSWEANPAGLPLADQRRIVIRLGAQALVAYQGAVAMLQTPITTGRPALATPTGASAIFFRASPYLFRSPWGPESPYWYAPSWVTWALEFRAGGYYLHDAPWQPDGTYGPGSEDGPYASHGCVHVPPAAMRFLYGWAPLGTVVEVRP